CPNSPEQHEVEVIAKPRPPLSNASLPESALPSPLTLKPPRPFPSATLLKKLPVAPLIAFAFRRKPQPPLLKARLPVNVTPMRLEFRRDVFDLTTKPSPAASCTWLSSMSAPSPTATIPWPKPET